ncbi:hypothetical protein QF028_002286 [Neobacillus sp. B4I6]|uniref:hypothetical protein n=1 Tax=Neobacillus sp. B4I6 TaxID=3373925 RepID=UPI003D199C6A
MLEKSEGTINEIVYEFTAYRNGKYIIYPTISDLYLLLFKIIRSNATTEYIRINPFYINEKVNLQREFDEYMFYLECREQFTVQDEELHILENLGREANTVTSEEFETGKILTPLCRYDDPKTYKSLLEGYRKFLNMMLPSLFESAKVDLDLTEEDLAFGYFCFEIHSE